MIATAARRVENLRAIWATLTPATEEFAARWQIVMGTFPTARAAAQALWGEADTPVAPSLGGLKEGGPVLSADLTVCLRGPVNEYPAQAAVQLVVAGAEPDEWIWFCDDDNCARPGFFWRLAMAIRSEPEKRAWAFRQARPGGVVRGVSLEMLRAGEVDAAQVVLRRDLVADPLWPREYVGDGPLIQALHAAAPERFGFVDELWTNGHGLAPAPETAA